MRYVFSEAARLLLLMWSLRVCGVGLQVEAMRYVSEARVLLMWSFRYAEDILSVRTYGRASKFFSEAACSS